MSLKRCKFLLLVFAVLLLTTTASFAQKEAKGTKIDAGSAAKQTNVVPSETKGVVGQVTTEQIDNMEKTLATLIQHLTKGKIKIETASTETASTDEAIKLKIVSPAQSKADALNYRIKAIQKTLANITKAASSPGDCGYVGCNCRIVKVCVAIGCCRWGAPPSDPGTVKCMQQCCVAWEERFVCR